MGSITFDGPNAHVILDSMYFDVFEYRRGLNAYNPTTGDYLANRSVGDGLNGVITVDLTYFGGDVDRYVIRGNIDRDPGDLLEFILPPGWTAVVDYDYYDAAYYYTPIYILLYDETGRRRSRDFFTVHGPADPNNLSVCFVGGTKITAAKADGSSILSEHAIDHLKIGDLIQTIDGTMKPISWIGSSLLTSNTLEQFPNKRPIIFEAGAIGNTERLRVSPQHRIFVKGTNIESASENKEFLVPAKHLVNDTNIYVDNSCEEFRYYHLMFKQHEIIRSEGAWSESFYPGRYAMDSIGENVKNEILFYFPELESANQGAEAGNKYGDFARPVLKRKDLKDTIIAKNVELSGI